MRRWSPTGARAGARTTSVDLSKKYLEWGRRNFALNGLDPAPHDFLYGDVFDWLRRLGKKERRFDVIILDPPTFSRSKSGEVFRVERDGGKRQLKVEPWNRVDGQLYERIGVRLAIGWTMGTMASVNSSSGVGATAASAMRTRRNTPSSTVTATPAPATAMSISFRGMKRR